MGTNPEQPAHDRSSAQRKRFSDPAQRERVSQWMRRYWDKRRNGKCTNGHELTPANTYTNTAGARICHTCHKQRVKDSLAKRAQSGLLQEQGTQLAQWMDQAQIPIAGVQKTRTLIKQHDPDKKISQDVLAWAVKHRKSQQ